MRIYLHDFGGYAFITDLSRELARRGHEIRHAYNARLTAGQGVDPRPDDPTTLSLAPIRIRHHFDKYSLARRPVIEREYGRAVAGDLHAYAPDVAITANTPLLSLWQIQQAARAIGAGFGLWLQDLLGAGIAGELQRRLHAPGVLAGQAIQRLERTMLGRADQVIAISDAFTPIVTRSRVPAHALTVIPNWAPLTPAPLPPRDNAWALEHGLTGHPVLLYSGTLGRKHDPAILLRLAAALATAGDGEIVVVSEGPVVDELAAAAARQRLPLRVLPFQPYARLPEMLASADVLLALLTPDAGTFSVPSKVLTYLSAGRPVLASMPPDNLAARLLAEHDAGRVVPPGDDAHFVATALDLLEDAPARERLGANGRRYAEEHFDLTVIGDRFEQVLTRIARPKR